MMMMQKPPPPHNNFIVLCYVWTMTLGLLALAAYLIWSVL